MARRVNIPQSQIDPFYRYTRQRLSVTPGKANTTILTNLDAIAHAINRPTPDLVAFLRKKTGTSATIKPEGVLVKGQPTANELDAVIEEFIETQVLCGTCGNPETDPTSSTKTRKCRACGATTK
jgi:translation initiation factor 2 beta subunit (eIF-2beta)/eIF-5